MGGMGGTGCDEAVVLICSPAPSSCLAALSLLCHSCAASFIRHSSPSLPSPPTPSSPPSTFQTRINCPPSLINVDLLYSFVFSDSTRRRSSSPPSARLCVVSTSSPSPSPPPPQRPPLPPSTCINSILLCSPYTTPSSRRRLARAVSALCSKTAALRQQKGGVEGGVKGLWGGFRQ